MVERRKFEDTLTIDRDMEDKEYEVFYKFAIQCTLKRWIDKCQQCGCWFESRRNNHRFCSARCRLRHWRAKPEIIKYCPICNQPFKTMNRQRIYCSDACYHREKYLRRKTKKHT